MYFHRPCMVTLFETRILQAHLDECKFVPVMCPKRCGKELEKSMLRAHLQEECPKREVKCDFCNIPITVEQEESHLTVCGKFMIPCPNDCKKGEIPREEVSHTFIVNTYMCMNTCN